MFVSEREEDLCEFRRKENVPQYKSVSTETKENRFSKSAYITQIQDNLKLNDFLTSSLKYTKYSVSLNKEHKMRYKKYHAPRHKRPKLFEV
jgi:hypothetical protein